MSDEDIKSLVDVGGAAVCEQRQPDGTDSGDHGQRSQYRRTAADRQSLANAIRDILIEQTASGSTRSTARPASG